ncbi:unnamed protein product, partial [Rotaria magnacalcarata]
NMSDVEIDTENVAPSAADDDIVDVELDSSTVSNEKYRSDRIEHLLKTCGDAKQYSIVKNSSQLIKSDGWNMFGFPVKNTMISNNDKEKLKEKIVSWACLSIRPFTIVEDCGFNDLIRESINIGQKYTGDIDVEHLLPTANTVRNNVPDAGVLCIIPDLWSDKHRKICYIGLSCSFVNDRFQSVAIDLCCGEYDEMDKTGKSVYLSIRKQLTMFGLEYYFDNKKLLFMSDRGSNIIKALEGHDVLFCFGHRINNVLQRAFYQTGPKQDKQANNGLAVTPVKRRIDIQDISDEELDSDVEDIYKRPSPSRHHEATIILSKLPNEPKELLGVIVVSKSLVKYVKLTGLNKEIQDSHGVALQQSNITRWLSLSSLLKSVESSIEHVRALLSTKSSAQKQKVNLNKIHIGGLKDLVILLDTFQEVIKMIQTGDRPTLHMVYVSLNKLKLHLDGKDVNMNGDPKLIDDRHEGTDFFRQRIKQLLSLMFHLDKKHLAAALLHPQYRKLTFIDDYKKSKTHIYVRQLLAELYDDNVVQHQVNSTLSSHEPQKKKHKTIEEQFVDPEDDDRETFDGNESSTSNKGDELTKYLKMQIEDKFKTPNPLPFWKFYQDKLPNLAKIARRFFSIPATSAGVERQFSAAGVLINERRASLNPETVEDVLFVRSIKKALMKCPDLLL